MVLFMVAWFFLSRFFGLVKIKNVKREVMLLFGYGDIWVVRLVGVGSLFEDLLVLFIWLFANVNGCDECVLWVDVVDLCSYYGKCRSICTSPQSVSETGLKDLTGIYSSAVVRCVGTWSIAAGVYDTVDRYGNDVEVIEWFAIGRVCC